MPSNSWVVLRLKEEKKPDVYLKFKFNWTLFFFFLVSPFLLRSDSCFTWGRLWHWFLRQDITFGQKALEGNFQWGLPGGGVVIGQSLTMGCLHAGRVLGAPSKVREAEGGGEGGKMSQVGSKDACSTLGRQHRGWGEGSAPGLSRSLGYWPLPSPGLPFQLFPGNAAIMWGNG